jgi:hypothetical protein
MIVNQSMTVVVLLRVQTVSVRCVSFYALALDLLCIKFSFCKLIDYRLNP